MILGLNNADAAALTRSRFLMGTLLEATLDDPSAASALEPAFAEVARLEGLLSTFIPASEVSRLNAAAGTGPRAVSPELWEVLAASSRAYAASGGAFDPTFASTPSGRGFSKLAFDPGRRTVSLPSGARLDFGGIGKGYALDRAAAVLRGAGVRRALLDFGGQVLALGSWTIEGPAGPLTLEDASASTSGEEEQPGHIKDPATGRAARRRPPVTVVTASATEADALSTALYVGGSAALPRPFSGCALVIPLKGAPPERFGDCPRREP